MNNTIGIILVVTAITLSCLVLKLDYEIKEIQMGVDINSQQINALVEQHYKGDYDEDFVN
jgi:uncharacterized membrane protein YgaE (UPF0421/DUF939 family)